jgi:transketolase
MKSAAIERTESVTPEGVTQGDLANAIRALAMDAVQKANSGHPGMPMGMADVATVLVREFLNFDPAHPDWPDRDRLVLSAGHGSMLLYALLYLTGYADMTIDEIKNFRQLGARTAGHPEYGHASGIETTTGPLGQGLANAVGMAIAERHLAARHGDDLVDHWTYAIAGDGCLMEGISHEAISLAGHLQLSRLIVLFDDNHISIDGPTDLSVSDDQLARFAASNWHVARVDGHDPSAVSKAIAAAKADPRPSLIACRTVIGYGAPNKQGTSSSHGAALGADEVAAARLKLGWPHPPFEIPAAILNAWRQTGAKGAKKFTQWQARLASADKARRAEFERVIACRPAAGLDAAIMAYKAKLAADKPKWATRKSSQMALEAINPVATETVGGSADLTGSNNTLTANLGVLKAGSYGGRYLYYGVREHAMAAIMNGMALHRGIIPYGGTFLVFADYCRPAIRLSALMGQRVIYVMTHDSIGLGEDGPTHQPVEHLAALRAIPNLLVLRPADAIETLECWQIALESSDRPSVLALSRQDLPAVRLEATPDNLCRLGAYELRPALGQAKVTLLASGSEISLAMTASDLLTKDGIATRIVSVPCFELFDAQPLSYRQAVLGPGTVRIAVEAGVRQGWDAYISPDGSEIGGGFVGMRGFGASAPYQALYAHFGITPEKIAQSARAGLAARALLSAGKPSNN